MNVEAINKTIEAIRNIPGSQAIMGSYASSYVHTCGTAHCIGGWAVVANGLSNGGWFLKAANVLGLNITEAEDLFGLSSWNENTNFAILEELTRLSNYSMECGTITMFDSLPHEQRKGIMIQVLETLRDTGKVDWVEALKAQPTA